METDRRVCVVIAMGNSRRKSRKVVGDAVRSGTRLLTIHDCEDMLHFVNHTNMEYVTFKMDEVWTHLDKDLKLVFIESLNTETRMNVTGLARLSWKLPIRISVSAPALNSRPALKSLEFQKTEKVLELFWKKSGRP